MSAPAQEPKRCPICSEAATDRGVCRPCAVRIDAALERAEREEATG